MTKDELIDKLASALEHTLNFAPAVKRRKEQHDYLINLIRQARVPIMEAGRTPK